VKAADAPPDGQFWLGFHRHALASTAYVAATFDVPFSGTPDLNVIQLDLQADNGQTRVVVTVEDRSFAPAKASHALYEFSDASQTPVKWTTASRIEHALGPFVSRTWTSEWVPKTVQDQVHYVTDSLNEVDELYENNNSQMVALSTVDSAAPVITLLG